MPMGDSALIRGVAAAAKQISRDVKIIGVQSERAPSYFLSWKEGRAIETGNCDTIADGLATRTPVAANVQAIRELVDEVVLVSEEEMLRAIGRLAIDEHIVAEPAGAAATAAFLRNGNKIGRRPVLLVTGANISPEILEKALAFYGSSKEFLTALHAGSTLFPLVPLWIFFQSDEGPVVDPDPRIRKFLHEGAIMSKRLVLAGLVLLASTVGVSSIKGRSGRGTDHSSRKGSGVYLRFGVDSATRNVGGLQERRRSRCGRNEKRSSRWNLGFVRHFCGA